MVLNDGTLLKLALDSPAIAHNGILAVDPLFLTLLVLAIAVDALGAALGAIARTRPVISSPLAAVTFTSWPLLTRPTSLGVTSPRHSRRPWRTRRNSSWPAPTTAR